VEDRSLLVVEGLVEGDQALLEAEDGGLGAVGELELGQDAGDVRLDGAVVGVAGAPAGKAKVGAAAKLAGQAQPVRPSRSGSSARSTTPAWLQIPWASAATSNRGRCW
jgi:hypothetical protein